MTKPLEESIVDVLAKKHPFHAGEIREAVHVEFGEEFSNQAVHKALHRLRDDDVVVKNADRTYQLSMEYILELEKRLATLRRNYFSKKEEALSLAPGETRKFEASDLVELDVIWNRVVANLLAGGAGQDADYVQYVPHAWFNLVQLGEEIKIVEHILSECQGFYTLVGGDGKLDDWIGKFYESENSYYATGGVESLNTQTHVAVLGEYMLEATYPAAIADKLDQIFKSANEMASLNPAELMLLAHRPAPLMLTLRRDAKQAQSFREKILQAF